MKINTGDCFEVGQVWMSPRGTLYRVMEGPAPMPGHYSPKVVLRQRSNGTGRKVLRDWDAVIGWVIDTHADGRKAGAE